MNPIERLNKIYEMNNKQIRTCENDKYGTPPELIIYNHILESFIEITSEINKKLDNLDQRVSEMEKILVHI